MNEARPIPVGTSDLEALHLRAEAMMAGFSYKKPDVSRGKGVVRLAKTDNLRCNVQIVKKDSGENNLHYHSNGDSFWMVLKGKVRFYGPEDKPMGEFGPMEGICTPAFARYWFENAGDDELEILHISGLTRSELRVSGRTDLEAQKFQVGTSEQFDGVKE
jgi:mannose-6-phosphate isomerase-like protein (cupin superfamily)